MGTSNSRERRAADRDPNSINLVPTSSGAGFSSSLPNHSTSPFSSPSSAIHPTSLTPSSSAATNSAEMAPTSRHHHLAASAESSGRTASLRRSLRNRSMSSFLTRRPSSALAPNSTNTTGTNASASASTSGGFTASTSSSTSQATTASTASRLRDAFSSNREARREARTRAAAAAAAAVTAAASSRRFSSASFEEEHSTEALRPPVTAEDELQWVSRASSLRRRRAPGSSDHPGGPGVFVPRPPRPRRGSLSAASVRSDETILSTATADTYSSTTTNGTDRTTTDRSERNTSDHRSGQDRSERGEAQTVAGRDVLSSMMADGNPAFHIIYASSLGPSTGASLVVVYVGDNSDDGEQTRRDRDRDRDRGGRRNLIIYLLTGQIPGLGSSAASYEELMALQERLGVVNRGAPQEEVNSLKTTAFEPGKFDDPRCPICLYEYIWSDSLRVLPCSHHFHQDCVDKWLVEQVNSCPLCREAPITRDAGNSTSAV